MNWRVWTVSNVILLVTYVWFETIKAYFCIFKNVLWRHIHLPEPARQDVHVDFFFKIKNSSKHLVKTNIEVLVHKPSTVVYSLACSVLTCWRCRSMSRVSTILICRSESCNSLRRSVFWSASYFMAFRRLLASQTFWSMVLMAPFRQSYINFHINSYSLVVKAYYGWSI